jgi:beta-phosphoglucomutase-like phosphatase (HAD superfamily)
MTVVQILRRPEAVNFEYDGLIADTGPLRCKAFRQVLDPLGVRVT